MRRKNITVCMDLRTLKSLQQNKCESCCVRELYKTLHKRKHRERRKILEIVHLNLIEPISPSGIRREKYIQMLIDDKLGYMVYRTAK